MTLKGVSGRPILVAFECFAKILLSAIHIISNLWLTRLRKILKCAEMEEIFKRRIDKSCCFIIFSFLNSEISQ